MIYLDDLYSEELKEVYFEKVKSLFSKTIKASKKRTIQWHPGYVTALMNKIKRLIGQDTFELYFTGQTDDEKFKQLILLPPKAIQNIVEKIKSRWDAGEITQKFFENECFQRLKIVYTKQDIMGKQRDKEKLNIKLVKALKITVCPYCNRNFINNRDDKLGAQMDHFYSKDVYPIFAVSLYNFVPVCGVCNNIKRTKDFKANPFIREDIEKHEVNFTYNYKKLDEFEVVLSSSDERKSDVQAINLEEAYAIHSIDIQNMLDREARYSQLYRDELREIFKIDGLGTSDFQLSLTDDEIDRMIYGDSVFEEDIRNIPLGKFRKDIYQEIKNLRKD